MNACDSLAETATRLAAAGHRSRRFLVELGSAAGGVRSGPLWVIDAGLGGRNVLSGRGFRRRFDDGSDGQARHFAGLVAVSARLGAPLTRWLSVHVGRDHPDSADGRLTDSAIAFASGIRSGELAQSSAAEWIRRELCASRR
ncbi:MULTISPECIES: hypothetical protein [unclassified Leifsonia]|uniref:hypothetical protein n=1 Tax=unclassified Leifsonia TaxID=2663824 RepID=UPI0006F52D0A|nr:MULTISPECIES: hypothetical protein [unclassified Leifsonia]KQX05061.1 hypothetical protein ASC59_12610 [Leifsonia sp. Root1293]KRA08693.1 hypothetical protein ASD61_12610 [Leifsonia sp. Root60]